MTNAPRNASFLCADSAPNPNLRETPLSQSVRDRIIASGRELIAKHGLAGFSINAVIADSAVSRGGFFHHFPTREALLDSIIQAATESFRNEMDRHRERGASFAEALVDAACEQLQHNARLLAALVTSTSTDKALAAFVAEEHRHWLDVLVAEGMSRDEAYLLTMALDGVLLAVLRSPEPPSKTEIARSRRVLKWFIAQRGRK